MKCSLKSPHGRELSLERPRLMGILNVTPDSFSDGGRYDVVDAAVQRAFEMLQEGAEIIDIGGESTGPGSGDVSIEEELERVIPVVEALHRVRMEAKGDPSLSAVHEMFISVDTWKSEVAEKAIEAGADMVNDVTGLRGDADMASVVGRLRAPVVVMYSKDGGSPRTTKDEVQYDDIVATIHEFFMNQMKLIESSGISKEQVILDPGMGAFVSADPKYSHEILMRLRESVDAFDVPILVGASRKGFVGVLQGGSDGPHDRLEGSLAAATMALMNGAKIIRAHDVKETRRVMDFVRGLL